MSSQPAEALSQQIDRKAFIRACAQFATGITVASVIAPDGTPQGMTVNSFTSVSLEPPLVLFCIDLRSRLLDPFTQSKYFSINILDDSQEALSRRFAQSLEERFEGVSWQPGASGAPILDGVLASFECERAKTVEAGDHVILIGRVVQMAMRPGAPLVYFGSGYRQLEPQANPEG
jgi:flavin reductase (DIM6/NTAB) family NADH-FMN oxidoreductase RutF